MISRHRNKARIGIALWVAVCLLWGLLYIFKRHDPVEGDRIDYHTFLVLVWSTLIFQPVCFLWAAYHLARGKGYSTAIILPGLFPCFEPIVLAVLLALEDKFPRSSPHPKQHKSQHRHESGIARVVRYRRNALVGNMVGLFGIFIGVLLTVFPVGFAANPENAQVVGIFIFLGGYSGVITGCWWWARAKALNEAVVFIGLVPLAILLIPWVRLIYVAIPLLLPLSMLMMTLILLVVIFALPDKSGMQHRRPMDLSRIRSLAGQNPPEEEECRNERQPNQTR